MRSPNGKLRNRWTKSVYHYVCVGYVARYCLRHFLCTKINHIISNVNTKMIIFLSMQLRVIATSAECPTFSTLIVLPLELTGVQGLYIVHEISGRTLLGSSRGCSSTGIYSILVGLFLLGDSWAVWLVQPFDRLRIGRSSCKQSNWE